jgi:RNA polymerase sigma factor (sigma-70 family)
MAIEEARPGIHNGQTHTSSTTEQVVRAAVQGDRLAREQLVRRFDGVVWRTVRRFRLNEADAQDAVQNTWLQAFAHLESVRNSDRLPGWLATTARRECVKLFRGARHETVRLDVEKTTGVDHPEPHPEQITIDRSMKELLWQHLARLPVGSRDLLITLVASNSTSYAEFARRVGMPIGSIGPTRSRCLKNLRRQLEDAGLGATAWR